MNQQFQDGQPRTSDGQRISLLHLKLQVPPQLARHDAAQVAAQDAAQLAAQVAAQLAAHVAPQLAPQVAPQEPPQLFNSVGSGQSSTID